MCTSEPRFCSAKKCCFFQIIIGKLQILVSDRIRISHVIWTVFDDIVCTFLGDGMIPLRFSIGHTCDDNDGEMPPPPPHIECIVEARTGTKHTCTKYIINPAFNVAYRPRIHLFTCIEISLSPFSGM